ncbi:MAG: hypothetical protein ACLT4C_09220 [Butyricicoccus sp.]
MCGFGLYDRERDARHLNRLVRDRKGKYTGYEIDGTDVSIGGGHHVFSGDCDNG